MVRWPGKIKPGTVSNDIISHLDWLPTLLAAAGMPDVKDKLLSGHKPADMTYKVHLDGYNFLPYLTGQEARSPRVEYFYFSDEGDLMGLRYDNWKIAFRTDPFERASITSNTYYDWLLDHAFLLVPSQAVVGQFLATFKDYPPRQKAASFTITQVLQKLSGNNGND